MRLVRLDPLFDDLAYNGGYSWHHGWNRHRRDRDPTFQCTSDRGFAGVFTRMPNLVELYPAAVIAKVP
jgi:hypothetical protein